MTADRSAAELSDAQLIEELRRRSPRWSLEWTRAKVREDWNAAHRGQANEHVPTPRTSAHALEQLWGRFSDTDHPAHWLATGQTLGELLRGTELQLLAGQVASTKAELLWSGSSKSNPERLSRAQRRALLARGMGAQGRAAVRARQEGPWLSSELRRSVFTLAARLLSELASRRSGASISDAELATWSGAAELPELSDRQVHQMGAQEYQQKLRQVVAPLIDPSVAEAYGVGGQTFDLDAALKQGEIMGAPLSEELGEFELLLRSLRWPGLTGGDRPWRPSDWNQSLESNAEKWLHWAVDTLLVSRVLRRTQMGDDEHICRRDWPAGSPDWALSTLSRWLIIEEALK